MKVGKTLQERALYKTLPMGSFLEKKTNLDKELMMKVIPFV